MGKVPATFSIKDLLRTGKSLVSPAPVYTGKRSWHPFEVSLKGTLLTWLNITQTSYNLVLISNWYKNLTGTNKGNFLW